MKEKHFAEEERRQREKEARSRMRRQEQYGRGDASRYSDSRRGSSAYGQERRRGSRGRGYDDGFYGYDDEYYDYDDYDDYGGGSRKGRRRKRLLVVLLILALAAVAAVLVHNSIIHAPEIPGATQSEGSEGTDPGTLAGNRREDVYTFLLVGRDDGGGGNTDTIMVGCYDVKNGTVDVLSIFRDTLVDVPWEIKKINSVYNRQGIEGLQTQVKNLIGYTPDYYFVVELGAIPELVEAIGGVDYDVPYDMHYDDPSQNLHIHFEKGPQHINGEDAVRLLRWRKNNSGAKASVGDIGRVEIQHDFLKALAKQTVSLGNLTKIKQIAQIVTSNMTSNLGYGEMLWFGEHMMTMNSDNLQFYSLPGDYNGSLWSKTYHNYQSYVFVNASELLDLVNQHLNPYQEAITLDMQHILNETTANTQTTLPAQSSSGSKSDSTDTTDDITGSSKVTKGSTKKTTGTTSGTSESGSTKSKSSGNTKNGTTGGSSETDGKSTEESKTSDKTATTPGSTGGTEKSAQTDSPEEGTP